MKSILTGIFLLFIIFYFNSCTNPAPIIQKQDSATNVQNHSLAGELFFIGPEFDSTSVLTKADCDACSFSYDFINDSVFLSVAYMEDGSSYTKGNYRYNRDSLVLYFDSITVDEYIPEEITAKGTADSHNYNYNTSISQGGIQTYKKTEFKGKVIFTGNNEFGTIDTTRNAGEIMNYAQSQGIWNRLTGKTNYVSKNSPGAAIENLMGSWALKGQSKTSLEIQESVIFYPEKGRYVDFKVHQDSMYTNYDTVKTAFLVSIKGSDTLILQGEERKTYYRVKK